VFVSRLIIIIWIMFLRTFLKIYIRLESAYGLCAIFDVMGRSYVATYKREEYLCGP